MPLWPACLGNLSCPLSPEPLGGTGNHRLGPEGVVPVSSLPQAKGPGPQACSQTWETRQTRGVCPRVHKLPRKGGEPGDHETWEELAAAQG